MTSTTIESVFRKRLIEIVDDPNVPVFGFQSFDEYEGASVVFSFEHGRSLQDVGEGSSRMVHSDVEISVQSTDANDIWPLAQKIRLGLFNQKYPAYFPFTGVDSRRHVHWLRPDKGGSQGVSPQPVIYLEIIRAEICFDDTVDGIYTPAAPVS